MDDLIVFFGAEDFERRASSEVSQIIARGGKVISEGIGPLLLEKMKMRTPIKTGALRSTGMVHPIEKIGNESVLFISFGGPSAPYAVHVHERLDLKHAAPTQAKFMSSVMEEEQGGVEYVFGIMK